jgi:acetyltransferase-like isoleucine patch superfamily enzyme
MDHFIFLKYLKFRYHQASENFSRFRLFQKWLSQGVSIDHTVMIRLNASSSLEIGKGTSIGAYTILDLLPDPTGIKNTPSKIMIGKRVAINEFNNIRASGGEICIGDGCLLSQFVSIVGSNHSIYRDQFIRDQPWDKVKMGVTIEQDVWIGTHAVILPGTHIQRGVIVAAGAVVTEDIPEYSIVAGIPARVIGARI